MSNVVKVVCSHRGDGRRQVEITRLGHRDEDLRPSIGPEDFAPESGTRLTAEDVEALTLHAGATVRPGRGMARETRPDGGTKIRARCLRCGLNLPLSWDTLNRSDAVRRLRDAGVAKIELYDLIQRVQAPRGPGSC